MSTIRARFVRPILALMACSLQSAFVCPVEGAVVLQPTDLSPGDAYRLVFVTSGKTQALSNDIGDYNNFVDGFGDQAMASDWTAIASTSTVNARVNTGTTDSGGVPLYNLNGLRVADDYGDFWDETIDNPIKFTETGGTVNEKVWTGTDKDGETPAKRFLGTDNTSEDQQALVGNSTGTTGGWIRWGYDPLEDLRHVYGISEVLTVPVASVPEPTSVMTWTLLGIVCFIGKRWHRRR